MVNDSNLSKLDVDFYKGKKVLVTGHTGFKGTWLISWLNLLGATIKGYALPPATEFFGQVAPEIAYQNFYGDIRNKDLLKKEIENFEPDIIFHLAAQALVRSSYQIPAETFEVNAIGTANLLEAVTCLQKKCAVVVITTDKVYQNKEINYHYKEDDTLGGYDPYSASKAVTEILVNSFRDSFFNRALYSQHNKAIVTARAGNVIGGGDWSKDRIIPDIVKALQKNEKISVRNPSAVRPWQHVLEPLSGYLVLGKSVYEGYTSISNAYNFGPNADDHLPVKDLVEIAVKVWGSGTWAPANNENEPHEANMLMLDITRAKKELSWAPVLSSGQAIEWTINWYKADAGQRNKILQNQIANYQNLQ